MFLENEGKRHAVEPGAPLLWLDWIQGSEALQILQHASERVIHMENVAAELSLARSGCLAAEMWTSIDEKNPSAQQGCSNGGETAGYPPTHNDHVELRHISHTDQDPDKSQTLSGSTPPV